MNRHPLMPWSHSRLSLYERCPAQANYRYVQKLPQAKSPQASRGTNIHESIERYLMGEHDTVHEDVVKYIGVFDSVASYAPKLEYKIAVTAGWNPAVWDQCWGRGVLDSVYRDDDDVVQIQEWKSGKQYEEHEDQRRGYIALSVVQWPMAAGYVVTTYYLDLGIMKTLVNPDVSEIQEDLTNRVRIMMTDTKYAPRPGFYCKWCSYSRYKDGPCKVG